MKNISDWLDKIIEDLVNPDIKLSNTFLKVQVLAFKIENNRLSDWVELELNGYIGKTIPDYRKIPIAIQGNLIQDAGFQGIWTKKKVSLPIEYLDKKYWDELTSIRMEASLPELEKMIAGNGTYHVNVPHYIISKISEITDPWHVDSAWKAISNNSLEGIISTIKSTLLNFLLELNKEFGDNDNLSIMKKKGEVQDIFDKTIGVINSDKVNISIGEKSSQSITYGDNSRINSSTGDGTSFVITEELKQDLSEFVESLQEVLDDLKLEAENREDVSNELVRLNSQLTRVRPNKGIINGALSTINGILTGVTANAYTPIVLDKLNSILGNL